MAAVGVMSFIWKTFFIGDGGRGGVSRGEFSTGRR